jgi:probable O-glycosylation ligase (exosortase A-associated)
MRDLVFIAFLLAVFGAGFRKPFIFVLAYVYIDNVSPQRLTYLLLNAVPISAIAFALCILGWALMDNKADSRFAPRQGLMLALLVWCFTTTKTADFPVEAAEKWEWVWKALAFAIFLPLTLRTRLRIEALLFFMIASAASIIIVGGIKTLGSGGGYGELNLMVTSNSGLYEGSTISTVAIAIIPLILWFAKHGTIVKPDWKVKGFCFAYVFACLLIPIGTSTRTGLLCIGLLALLMLRNTKRKFLYLGLLAGAGALAVPFLPAKFTGRMETIKTYKGDESASTRLAVWAWTWDYVKEHPLGGGFEMYRQNRIRLDLEATPGAPPVPGSAPGADAAATGPKVVYDKARAFHSAYFEMLGEQGWPGFLMWLGISIGGLLRMEVLRRRYRRPQPGEEWIAPLASALQSAHLCYLLGAAFIAIAFQPFVYMLVGAQIGLDTYLKRRRQEGAWRPMVRRRAFVATPA